MDSAFIHQAANELVQNVGTRNIKQIARSCSLDISETSRIKDKHILLYEHNAFTSHLMLDSDEVYQMTKHGLDAAQIAVAKQIHLNLVMVKLLELHHLGYDLRHYRAQHHAFIEHFRLPAYFRFDGIIDQKN